MTPTLLFLWSFMASLVVGLLLGRPAVAVLARLKAGQVASTDAPKRHLSKSGTPTMGGLIILTAVVAAVAIQAPLAAKLSVIYRPWHVSVWCTTLLAFGAIGFIDDLLIVKRGKNLGLKARQKLALQFAVAIGAVAFLALNRAPGITTSLYLGPIIVDLGWLYYPLAVLLIVGLSNAVNLADGLDGLASGLAVIAAIGMACAWMVGNVPSPWTLGLAGAFTGACTAFLWYNRHPAQVFMGDTGSLALGGGLGLLCLMMKIEVAGLLICLVFWAEMISVMIQVASFQTTGRRVFKMTPLHHHFELCGWKEPRIVAVFWAWGAAAAALGVLWSLWSGGYR